jgi:hypothetical protein
MVELANLESGSISQSAVTLDRVAAFYSRRNAFTGL